MPLEQVQTIAETMEETLESAGIIIAIVLPLAFFIRAGGVQLLFSVFESRKELKDELQARLERIATTKAQRLENGRTALLLRQELQDWLTDEAFAMRLFIHEAANTPLPEFVTRLEVVEAALAKIEELKAENLAGMAAMLGRETAFPAEVERIRTAAAQIKASCDALNNAASLSAHYPTGYRIVGDADAAKALSDFSHRLSQD